MMDLGIIRPGSTIGIPFGSFAASTGAPSAVTNYADADIQVYKDRGTTQRASAAGLTATTTFDTLTGVNLITLDTSDNTTADFWAAGSEYIVVISDITVDGQTLRFPLARFSLGIEGAVRSTTIATLASQTSFTLTAGSADDDAYNGCVAYIHDAASAIQSCFGVILDYTGSTKTVTLAADPAVFTMAAKDNIMILPPSNTRWLGTTTQTAKDVGAITITSGRVNADVTHIATAAVNTASAQLGVNVVSINAQTATAAAGVTFPSSIASPTNITAGTITTVTNLTNAPTSGDLTATMKTSVNAEVLDVLNTDTFAEPGQGAPAATATLAAKINYLYKAWRNKKTQTSTTWSLFADDASTVDQKSTVSDDGTTATRGEIATGP